MVPIAKKDGRSCLCIDYRSLDRINIKDKHPIPRINDTLDALTQVKYFSRPDDTSGDLKIPLNEQDFEKTAFNWKGAHYG